MAADDGRVAWITGAGTGIGESAALALAARGVRVVLTGRRPDKLDEVAARITASGGQAETLAGDVTDASRMTEIAKLIDTTHGRLDILVNNAGLNIAQRRWADLAAAGVDDVVGANLSGAFYAVLAVLPIMRRQRDGVLIHTASIAGRFVSPLAGAAYTAAKHAVVAMSHSLNIEECVNNIRSCAVCPGEVETPILALRPKPLSAEVRAKMLRPDDVGDLIAYVAGLPPHVCINEVLITPTWNRGYVAAMAREP